jgi:hypothetical protein
MSKTENQNTAAQAVALAAHIEAKGALTDEDVAELQKLRALLDKKLPPRQPRRAITPIRFS